MFYLNMRFPEKKKKIPQKVSRLNSLKLKHTCLFLDLFIHLSVFIDSYWRISSSYVRLILQGQNILVKVFFFCLWTVFYLLFPDRLQQNPGVKAKPFAKNI